jgi:hypothetical protein
VSNERELRFAVGSPDGPRSAVWRIWATRNGVYAAASVVAARAHVSLHRDARWHYRLKDSKGEVLDSHDWERPAPLKDGVTKAFAVIIPWESVAPRTVGVPEPDRVRWWPAPKEGSYRTFAVLFGPHGIEARNVSDHPGGPQLPLTIDLPEEKMFVLTRAVEAAPEFTQRLHAYKSSLTAAAQRHPRWLASRSDPYAPLFGSDDEGQRWFLDLTPLTQAR